jgi:phosphopantothenoylcysteine decarboxylase/phosphopantothenate--cysteine ligase
LKKQCALPLKIVLTFAVESAIRNTFFFASRAFFAINYAMNCLVTAGPTFEPLDDVRRLTNFSTGRLGTELANFLAARGHRVTLLLGESATYRGECRARSIKIFSTTADLRAKLKSFSGKKVDAIFHAAAVSDFAFGRMFTREAAGKLTSFAPSKKISTRGGPLLVELVPTPKIIAELRGWFPKTKVVGWKFEADGSRADALRAAEKQLADCATDFCVANGPAYGKGFNLVSADGRKHFADKAKLFTALENIICPA